MGSLLYVFVKRLYFCMRVLFALEYPLKLLVEHLHRVGYFLFAFLCTGSAAPSTDKVTRDGRLIECDSGKRVIK